MVKKKKRRTKREKVESLLKNYNSIFNILGLEKKAKFPKGTIHKFLRYERRLSDERIHEIDQLILKLIESYEKEFRDN
ncbi:hypothetical protein [Aquimarina latercula]|uniref:hypothetical protein n=1 Tax=Aquimarina latercula TaxID=987 RepID=UPI00040D3ECE|nr:hypothetical protein [Aquimarina latercula]